MCLKVNKAVKIKWQNSKAGLRVVAWKKYYKNGRHFLASVFRHHTVNRPGKIFGMRECRRVGKALQRGEGREVNYGIHVFLQRPSSFPGELIVPVLCYAKHLRAAGSFSNRPSAVFTQVTITPATWRKIFKA